MNEPRYYEATRKRDGQRCYVWLYTDAKGRLRVSCCRTQNAQPGDFHILGPVVSLVGSKPLGCDLP